MTASLPELALPPLTLAAASVPPAAPAPAGSGLELSFHADPYIYDGQFANNGWLQECPRPLTRLTWDNAVMISQATAKRLGLEPEDLVELRHEGRMVAAAVWVMPGQPDDSLSVSLGFGRTHAGRAGNGAGFDFYPLRTSGAPIYISGVEIKKLGKKYTLATTQHQSTTAKREVARVGTLADYQKNPEFAREMGEEVPGKGITIYPATFQYEGYAWGMSIDLGACVGCNACVVACQSENNIAIVGKDQVNRERIMHWLRIDRYYESDEKDNLRAAENPRTVFEPRRLRSLRKRSL